MSPTVAVFLYLFGMSTTVGIWIVVEIWIRGPIRERKRVVIRQHESEALALVTTRDPSAVTSPVDPCTPDDVKQLISDAREDRKHAG